LDGGNIDCGYALKFDGNLSGQGIGSRQTAGMNQYGLNFFTGWNKRFAGAARV
jgi:hypothetical protein